MKKTMIALVALSGLAMADTDLLVLPATQTSTDKNSGRDWVADPIDAYKGYDQGAYMYNGTGKVGTNLTSGEGIWFNTDGNGSVTLAKRAGAGGSGEAIVLDATALEDGYSLSALTFSVDSSSSSSLSGTITLNLALIKGSEIVKQSSETLTLGSGASTTLTLDNAVTWDSSYKIVAALNGLNSAASITGSNGQYYTLSGITIAATPTAVPEPTTATLSLLALAGLAARRRRH